MSCKSSGHSLYLSSLVSFTAVCVKVLTKFQEAAGKDVEDVQKSEVALKKFCKTLKGKEDSFVSTQNIYNISYFIICFTVYYVCYY